MEEGDNRGTKAGGWKRVGITKKRDEGKNGEGNVEKRGGWYPIDSKGFRPGCFVKGRIATDFVGTI